MKHLVVLAAVLMTGCAGIQSQDAVKMTPEQLTALVKDKSATAYCLKVMAAGYSATVTTANLDQNTIKGAGKVQINPDNCGMEIDTAPAELKPVVK